MSTFSYYMCDMCHRDNGGPNKTLKMFGVMTSNEGTLRLGEPHESITHICMDCLTELATEHIRILNEQEKSNDSG